MVIEATFILLIWLIENVGFHPTFSRHGRIEACFILLIWLIENVQHLFCQRHIPCAYLIYRWRMTAGKMETPLVMLQEERFEVCQRVLLAKQSPDTVFTKRIA